MGSTLEGLGLEALTFVVVRLQQRRAGRRCEVGLKPQLPIWILGVETVALLGVANELEGGWRRCQCSEAMQGEDEHRVASKIKFWKRRFGETRECEQV